jgi:hypothetical protein
MESSIFIGRLFAIIYLTVGIAALAHRSYYRSIAQSIVTNSVVLLVLSLIALTVGASIVILHNVWVPDWPVVITILGWFAMVKGMTFIFLPERTTLWISTYMAREDVPKLSACTAIGLGVMFAYFSFA